MYDPSQTPLVPETLLKRRRTLEELAERRVEHNKAQGKRRRVVRGESIKIKRPEKFVKEFRIREGALNKMNRRKRATEKRVTIAIPKEEVKTTVGFVVRIHKGRHSAPEIKSRLRKLGLVSKYSAVFMELTKENIAMLKPFDSYVAYGYISSQMVHELLHRRAYVKKNKQKQNLSNNLYIEELFGDKNILCVNDLAHEIYTVSPNFSEILSILAPFKLSSPTSTFQRQILDLHDEVESKGGFLNEHDMDVFLHKLL